VHDKRRASLRRLFSPRGKAHAETQKWFARVVILGDVCKGRFEASGACSRGVS
jgi:hypothetical protein